jgi:dCTP deaminase
VLDLRHEGSADESAAYERIDLDAQEFLLEPGQFALGASVEYFKFGQHCGLVLNRTSFARLGLSFTTSGYANPGYEGTLPLVITNATGRPVRLPSGRRVAQVLFSPVGEVDRMYKDRGSKYFGEKGPTASKHHLDEDLRSALRSYGLRGRRLQEAEELLDRRIEEVAASATGRHPSREE